jgi:hypothetical protein
LDRINSGNENIDDLTKQLEVLGLGAKVQQAFQAEITARVGHDLRPESARKRKAELKAKVASA